MAVVARARIALPLATKPISTTRFCFDSVEAGASADHIRMMGTCSAATVRLHVAALDLAEQAFLTLPEDDLIRSQSLSNLHIARQTLAMNPPNIRATHQVFREVRSAFPNYDTTNLPLARAINAARDAARPRL